MGPQMFCLNRETKQTNIFYRNKTNKHFLPKQTHNNNNNSNNTNNNKVNNNNTKCNSNRYYNYKANTTFQGPEGYAPRGPDGHYIPSVAVQAAITPLYPGANCPPGRDSPPGLGM